ncbi:MAG: hypothetical protein VX255_01315, partial [Candidatus Latescibacterota bacterium]|nr:hypothetical protein [Candidatus Latescibacterota bacterium]
MAEQKLISHWPLRQDARDVAGENHGTAYDVAFVDGDAVDGAAHFTGPSSRIEIPDAHDLRLANRDFSFSAWVRCDSPMRGAFG